MTRLADFNRAGSEMPAVCIAGSGPVGLALAAGLARMGVKASVLESGGPRPDAEHQTLATAESATDRQADTSLAVCRALGGTSWFWGGRCVPLDPIDFERQGAWPIGEADLASHHGEAAVLLGCGPPTFQDPAPGAAFDAAQRAGLRADQLERWCDEPILAMSAIGRGPPKVTLNATVTGVELTPAGDRVAALEVVTGSGASGVRSRIEAPIFVFACGGLETARLLLNIQADRPGLFGGPDGPLGRHYMGHLSGSIADIVFDNPADAKRFAYRDEAQSSTRRRLTLDAEVLRREQLPNIAFYPDNPRLSDPGHGSGVLSLLFLMLSTPVIGRRLVSEAIRQMQLSDTPRYASHMRNVLFDLPRTIAVMAGLAWQRIVRGRRKPFLFLTSRGGTYPLHYHAEHRSSPDSRVILGESRDPTGLRRVRIDLRFGEDDAAGVVCAHEALDRLLRETGLGRLDWREPPEQRAAAVLAQAHDGFHQIGLARMGTSPQDAVVDADCRVFGLDNLYLAGSAVFRSSGQANPTFSAVALGLRLADHLARQAEAARSRP